MKNIAIIITRMIPGGASKVVLQIIEAASRKYDITLIAGKEDLDNAILKVLSEECNVVIIPSLVRSISPLKDYKAYREIYCELRRNDFDVVHTHTSKAGYLGRKAAIKAEVPVIIHSPHGSIYTDGSNIEGVPSLSFGKRMLQMAEKSVGRNTTWLTTLSEHEKEICLNLALSKKENTVVIHNGIDIEKFSVTNDERKTEREKMGFEEDDIVLLSIGRLSSEKGHSVLIDAFGQIQKALGTRQEGREDIGEHRTSNSIKKRLCLIIVGDGPERENLEKQAIELQLSMNSNQLVVGASCGDLWSDVIFAGHCDEVKKYFAMSDIFILPSFYEGFGIVVLEAMAAGLPVIASRVGGLPEIISDGVDGILVSPSDPDLLYSSISELVESEEKIQCFANSGKENVKNFSVKKMQEAYLKLYE